MGMAWHGLVASPCGAENDDEKSHVLRTWYFIVRYGTECRVNESQSPGNVVYGRICRILTLLPERESKKKSDRSSTGDRGVVGCVSDWLLARVLKAGRRQRQRHSGSQKVTSHRRKADNLAASAFLEGRLDVSFSPGLYSCARAMKLGMCPGQAGSWLTVLRTWLSAVPRICRGCEQRHGSNWVGIGCDSATCSI